MRSRRGGMIALVVALAWLVVACGATDTAAETSDIFDAAPWADGEQLEYSLRDHVGDLVGRGTLTARLDGGRLVLEQEYVEMDPPGDMEPTTDDVTVIVDPATFRPIEGWREIVRRENGTPVTERYEWEYREVEGELHLLTRHIDGDEVSEDEVAVRDHHYDNESSLWLWRGAGLVEELDEHYVSVNAIESRQVTVNLRVPQVETVEVPAGEFEAWRILVRTGRSVRTAWINVNAPHEILRWDNGELTFDLEPPASAEED